MDSIASSIITPIVQSLMAPVKKHLGFLVYSTKYVNDMKEKLEELNLTKQDIQHNLDEAMGRNYEVSKHVSPWLEKVEKVNEKAQSIPTRGIGCFNMAKRYKAGKRSYNILEKIQDLDQTWKSKIVFTKTQIPLAVVETTSSTGPSTSTPNYVTQHNFFESRKSVFDEALKALQSNNESHKMIALSGMGGVGKTTMMEQLKKEVEASKTFDRVVKVVLGESMSGITDLQRGIANYLNVEDLREETTHARADRLHKMFEAMSQQGKKVLIIMDDLWNAFDLKDVGLSSPLPNGFKLLFTSRKEDVCIKMDVRNSSIFRVGFLEDIEAKSLFFRVVGLSDGDNPTLQKLGEDIVRKCHGLPIAIVTIAKSLSGNIEEAWKKALWRLEEDDIEDLESVTHRIFEMSYENLKKDEDKAIFILSGIFPDDFNIRIEDLFRFGWGLGCFKYAKTLATTRRDVKICVNNLIRANLLIESDFKGCVKMHDLVRAFVLDKITKFKQASITNYDNRSQQYVKESYDRILLSCRGMTKFPTDFNYPNLSMLTLMDGNELLKFPEDTYDRMEKLDVVSFENMHIPMFPEHSTKLRTLYLRSCRFINDDISLLGSLDNLEALSFIDCEIRRLPLTIGKLKKLRLLDLTGCVHLHIDDGVFQDLGRLEELYMRAYDGSPIRFTEANCDELEKLSHGLFALELEFFENKAKPKNMSFTNLERFRISIGCELVQLEGDETNLFKNTIQLVGDGNELLECKISDLFDKTEEFHLQVNEINHIEDILMHRSFSKLVVLHVSRCADMTHLFTVDVASGFKMLERLTVSKCHAMRTLVAEDSRVGVITFQKLSFMSLANLPKLISLCDNIEIELPKMEKLILDDLPNFRSIYSHMSEIQSLLNKKVVIPRLQKLYISRMEKLKQIWSCQVSTIEKNYVSILKEIRIRECDSLVNPFPSNPLPLLNHLEELEIEKCGSVEVLFNMEFESVYENGCKLRSIKVYNLAKLKELWRMNGVNKCDIHIKCFNGVENIKIGQCPIFKDIFTPVTTNFDLGALTNYMTSNMDEKIDGMLKGEITEMDDYIPHRTYPSYFLRTSHHLQQLELTNDRGVGEVVFDQLDSPYLQVLYLRHLEKLSHVWKFSNWNAFLIPQHQPQQLPFQNLTKIYLNECHKIKYLFSSPIAKYLSNLKRVDIRNCDGIEEVISSTDDESTTSTSSHQNMTTLFPHLETLTLNHLSSLKHNIDGGNHGKSRRNTIFLNTIHDETQSAQVIDACWSFCQYPKRIHIEFCDALGSLVPWYGVRQMKRLQEMKIVNCKTMMEIFESETITNNIVDEATLTSPTRKTIPILVVPQLSNLKFLRIFGCDLLTHVFTFSTLESLKQLKKLEVKYCKAIQVIVKEENRTSSKDVVFPRLEQLILDDLPNLKGFFLGLNDFKWPALDYVVITDCPELMTFTSGESKTPKLKYISTRLGKHSLESCGLNFHGTINAYQTTFPTSSLDPTISKGLPWSFSNLIEINHKIIIPSHALLQLEKLEKINVAYQSGCETVIEVELEGSGFNESQTTLVKIPIPNLKQVNLCYMNGLKYLWKSIEWLEPEFPNLTTVDIQLCGALPHVLTRSMVGSLLQLQDLCIRHCKNIEVIVKEEDEKECDGKVNVIIMLPCLKSLSLINLSSLKGFCLGNEAFSLPALDTLEIERCPAITVFTKGYVPTPELKVIGTSFGKYYVKPDLNSFIKTKQEEGYEF